MFFKEVYSIKRKPKISTQLFFLLYDDRASSFVVCFLGPSVAAL